MSSVSASRLQLLAAAVLFSTGGAAIKGTALTGWQVASFRSLVAAVVLFLLFPAAGRDWNWRTLAVAVSYAGTLVLFVLANKLTTSANAVFLQYTAPLYLLLIGPVLLREPPRRSDLLLLAAVALGMILCFSGSQAPQRTAPDPVRGNVVGVLAGVCWAFTLAGLRWVAKSPAASGSAMATVVAGNLLAGLMSLPAALPVLAPQWRDWLTIGYLGVFQIGLAYVCLTRGMRRVPAFEASMLLLLEPALNPVWSWLAHGEKPTALAVAGGALILGATVGRSALGRSPS